MAVGFPSAAAFISQLDEISTILADAIQEDRSVWIGTFHRGADAVEFGTGPHNTLTDQEGFIERLQKWGRSKGLSERDIFAIAEDIRERGTPPQPFWRRAVLRVVREMESLTINKVEDGGAHYQILADPLTLILTDQTLEGIAQRIQEEARANLVSHDAVATGALKDSIVIGATRTELESASKSAAGELETR